MSLARYLANLLNSSGQVEAAKLAATLDLSSKTLTYPDNSVQSADIASLAASKLSGQVPDANAPSGSVIQVVQVVKTDGFTTTTNAYQDITGLSISITPSSASNKILVVADLGIGNDAGNLSIFRLLRGSTVIYCGDASGSRSQSFVGRIVGDTRALARATAMFLDSPNTTSSVTYKVQCNSEPGYMVTVNRPVLTDLNDYRTPLTASSITLMEISA